MVCKHCGTINAKGSRFCIGCCAPLDYDVDEEEKLALETEKREKEKKFRKNRKLVIKLGCRVLSMCFVVFIGISIFFDKESKDFTVKNLTGAIQAVSNIREKNNVESNKMPKSNLYEITPERVKLEIGNNISSESYVLSFNGLEIIDKNNERAQFYNIVKGKEYVLINLSLENRTYEDIVYSSLLQFFASVDGKEVVESLLGILAEGHPSINGLNSRRGIKTGYICYYVPENWREIKIVVNIDGLENEPYLLVENPKNREISEEELEYIIDICEIEDFLFENDLYYLSDEELSKLITEYMHLNCLSKNDLIPSQGLQNFIKSNF